MGKGAPKPDPRIGEAALLSAKTGVEYLDFMKDQAAITNNWAFEDRERSKTVFEPLEDMLVQDALDFQTPERKAQAAEEAAADVRQQAALASDQNERRMAAMGVNPNSGRYEATARRSAFDEGLAVAGARNLSRRQVEDQSYQRLATAAGLGRNLAINPATSMGLSNSATSSGFQGAMQGYGQMGSLLNQQYQNQLQAWEANQGMWGGLASGLGRAAGAMGIFSSKDAKTDKEPSTGHLDAIKKMPIEKWRYKEGMGDQDQHVGTYAEDFQKHTGLGNGRTIGVIDALGVTMGAIKELAEKIDGKKGAPA